MQAVVDPKYRRFLVDRSALDRIEFEHADQPRPPADGQVLCSIDSFALTANNITYAHFGASALRYWDFYPAPAPWGVIPVWGYATVTASRHPDVAPGTRWYGYWPMATHALLSPSRASEGRMRDGAAHRQALAALYNDYTDIARDPQYRSDREAAQLLYKPLFGTAFAIDDFLAAERFFGANAIILSSASSKTASGVAFLLARRRSAGDTPPIRIVGLTSESNRDYVRSLGCYDEVLGYPALESAHLPGNVVYVDMAGSRDLRARVHTRFSDALTYSCSVGATQWDPGANRSSEDAPLPGPRPVLFFAPAQIEKRIGELGPAAWRTAFGQAWETFMTTVCAPANAWLEVQHHTGPDAVQRLYRQLLEGSIAPKDGAIASL